MEFRETTLTTGVAVPVTPSTIDNSSIVIAVNESENVSRDTVVEPEVLSIERESQNEVDSTEKVETAEKVLQSAKEEGFEKALTHLAEGDFDEQEMMVQPEVKTEESEKAMQEAEVVEEKVEEQEQEDKIVDPEKEFLDEQVADLEQKIINLPEKMPELAEKLGNKDERNQMTYGDFVDAMRIFLALIEEEKDKKKKKDMVNALVEFFKSFMIMMFVPDGEKIVEERDSKKAEQKEEQDPQTDPAMWAKVFKIMESRNQNQPTEHNVQAA